MTNFPGLPNFEPIEGLSKQANSRIYIYNTLADLVVYGYSNEEMLKLYQQSGYGIPQKEFNSIVEWVTSDSKQVFEISEVPDNKPIPDNVMELFATPHDTNYRYIGEFVTYDNETGERREWRYIYDTDYQLTPTQAGTLLMQEWEGEYPLASSVYVSSVNIVQAYRNL